MVIVWYFSSLDANDGVWTPNNNYHIGVSDCGAMEYYYAPSESCWIVPGTLDPDE